MPLAIDLSNDYLFWDATEAIRYEVAHVPGNLETQISVAKHRPVSYAEPLPSFGVYLHADILWLIPQKVIASAFQPKLRDVVIDGDGTRWTVINVERKKQRQTWWLTCRNLILAFDLRDTITIERASAVEDAAAAPKRVKSWKPLYANIAARVQSIKAQTVEARGIKGQETDYIVVVDRELPALDTRECRIKWANKYLDIVSFDTGSNIMELPRIEAKEKV